MAHGTLDDIKLEVKKLIIENLHFENIRPEEILDDVNFFSGENTIKIDSIDVIGLVVAIQKRFSVKIDNQNLAREIINNVNTIAEFVYAQDNES